MNNIFLVMSEKTSYNGYGGHGSYESLNVIAVCTSMADAEKIVDNYKIHRQEDVWVTQPATNCLLDRLDLEL
jgi:hypothetical protein